MRGGLPAKQGDRFEAADVVLALVEVLAGRATQVTWEQAAAGHGIDVVVQNADAVRGIQLKRRMGGALSKADRDGVRSYALDWLGRSARHRYTLRADTAVGPLHRLCEIAAGSTPEAWWDAVSADRTLRDEAAAWGGLSTTARRQAVHERLQRVTVEIMDEARTRHSAQRELALAGVGQPERAAAVLGDFAWQRLGIAMTRDEVLEVLRRAGVELRLDDPTAKLHARAESWCAEMDRARGPLPPIPRDATGEALGAIGDQPRLIAIHGPAGCGKTQVLTAVVRGLIARGTMPLIVDCARLDPARWRDDLGLGADPLAALVRAAGTRPAVLVLDQIDQALWSGRGPALVALQQLIADARRLGCTVVAGCRSVDCQDSRLAPLLAGFDKPSADRPDVAIAVGELSAVEVEARLVAAGVAPGELDPVLLPLLRRPILLRLLLDVARRHGASLPGIRGALDLIRRWRTAIAEELARAGHAESARRIEQQLVEAAERQGAARIQVERIDPADLPAVQTLVDTGVAVRSGDGRWLGWTHQVLLDNAVVRRWAERLDGGEPLAALTGPRSRQDLATAARLRLLVGVISLDQHCRAELDGMMRSEALRPMCRFAVLRGLAALESAEELEAWTPTVLGWLRDARLARTVTRDLLAGQPDWMRQCEVWLAGPHAAELRPAVIAALGTVATIWGEGVARVLREWERHTPGLTSETNRVFRHDPVSDSDALFALRLERVRHGPLLPDPPCDWPVLLQRHPRRMGMLLDAILPRLDAKTWRHPLALTGLGRCEVGHAVAAGRQFFEPLLAGWRSFALPEWGLRNEDEIWHLIELLGAACGGAASAHELTWTELDRILPSRWQDDLVRLVALDHWTEAPADAFFAWLTATPTAWAVPRTKGDPWRWTEAAIRRHAPRAERSVLDAFQHELCTRPDPRQFRRGEATATFLLNAVPMDLRTLEASAWLETHREILAQDRSDFDQVQGGSIRSDIDDDTAATMDDAAWQLAIDGVIGAERTWGKAGPGVFLSGSVRHYASQLHGVVSRAPRRGLALLERLDHPRYDAVRASIAEGMLNRTRTNPVEGWTADERTAAAVTMVQRGWRCCAQAVATCVASGEGGPWPEAVVDQLLGMIDPLVDGADAPALAWHGLEHIARTQAEQRQRIWSAIRADGPAAMPRLTALRIRVVQACLPLDPDGCMAAIRRLADDPAAAVQPDGLPILLSLVYEHHDNVLIGHLLAALDGSDPGMLQQAGGVIVALTSAGVVGPEVWRNAIARGSPDIWRGMAAAMLDVLRGSPADWNLEAWPQTMRDCCLALGACDDDETLQSISNIWYTQPGTVWDSRSAVRRLLDTPGFLAACAASKAVAHNPEPLLTACEQLGELLPVLPVIATAITGACAAPADAGWSWWHVDTILRIAARCLEEVQARGGPEQRQQMMDLWDRLIERGWPGIDGRVVGLLAR